MTAPQETGSPPPTQSATWLSILGGALLVLVTDVLTPIVTVENSPWSLALPTALMFLLALFIGRARGFAPALDRIGFILIGIAAGFFLDALIAEEVFHVSRNLWVLGPALYGAIGIVPITIGLLLGDRWRKRHFPAPRTP